MHKLYKNSTQLAQLHGVPIYMNDMVDACLMGRLNLFLQGDTGSGKTQLARDVMSYFGTGLGGQKFARDIQGMYEYSIGNSGNVAIDATKHFPEDKTLFVLGRNDMDTRELFQRFNLHKYGYKPKHDLEPLVNPETGIVEWYYPTFDNGVFIYKKISEDQAKIVKTRLERLVGGTDDIKELTTKINTHLIVVDELPNCVPAVRAQLFNLFDGFIEISGTPYRIGNGYSVGIATGNIGQKFTESSNDLGRALKDRMHVVIDTDYFFPTSGNTLEILAGNTNPRVEFSGITEDDSAKIIGKSQEIEAAPIPLEKLFIANYLLHGLDHCSKGSKRKMKEAWPTQLTSHEQGSDVALVLPVSPRAAKSIIRLSQSLDAVAEQKGANKETIEGNYFDSMMQAYKFVSAYSGVLNESMVDATYESDKYKALDAVITTTNQQFQSQSDTICAGLEMVASGKIDARVLNKFTDRWKFMRDTLEQLLVMQTK